MKFPILAGALCALAASAVAQIPIPAHSSIYNGYSRGFNFTAQTTFQIEKLDLPLDAQQSGDTAGYLIHVNGTEVFRSVGNAGAITLTTPIVIKSGDVVDIVGNWSAATTGSATAHNSYGSSAPYNTTIEGVAHVLNRTGWQWDIGDTGYKSGSMLSPSTGSIGRVLVFTGKASGLFADFTASPTFGTAGSTKVSFKDNSFSSAPNGVLIWQWDFGDGNTSSVQNPTHTYQTGGKFTVKLTVRDGVHTQSSKTKTDLIEMCGAGPNSGSITTNFVGNNGLTSANSGNMFKATVIRPAGIKVTEIDISTRVASGSPVDVDVYITADDYVGKNASPDEWVKVSSGTGTSAGPQVATKIDVDDFFLAPGAYGVYVVQTTAGGIYYTTGTATNTTVQNCDVRIEAGYGMGSLFSTGFNSPRVWNGTLRYAKDDEAGNGKYAYGCAGSNAMVPDLSISAEPVIGTSGTLDVADMVNTASNTGYLFIGSKKLMVDLVIMGAPGCMLVADPLLTVPFAGANGSASIPWKLPNSATLVGSKVNLQAGCIDAAANALGAASSNGLSLRLGN